MVTFLSSLYGGRISDKELTKRSGLLSLLERGDSVMADRGFDIAKLLPQGTHVNIPPFLGGREQLELDELAETQRIDSMKKTGKIGGEVCHSNFECGKKKAHCRERQLSCRENGFLELG